MTSPEGEKFCGYWNVTDVDEPTSFEFQDGFANEDFTPIETMPVSRNRYSFEEYDGGTRATYLASYESAEALQKVLDMGVIEGASGAINQIDELLAS